MSDFTTSGDLFEISISIVFMLFGLYFLFGRFIISSYEKKRTFYAVTNERVFIIANMRTKNVQAMLINQIPVLIKTVHKDDIGTIQFDDLKYDTSGEFIEYIKNC